MNRQNAYLECNASHLDISICLNVHKYNCMKKCLRFLQLSISMNDETKINIFFKSAFFVIMYIFQHGYWLSQTLLSPFTNITYELDHISEIDVTVRVQDWETPLRQIYLCKFKEASLGNILPKKHSSTPWLISSKWRVGINQFQKPFTILFSLHTSCQEYLMHCCPTSAKNVCHSA